jgi:chemotaxis protein methyltransferase CheR
MNDLTPELFRKYSKLVYERAGIYLTDSKQELLKARVGKIIRRKGISGFRAYFDMVQRDQTGREITLLLDSISTNLTYFFRENQHYELLKLIIKKHPPLFQHTIRLWSAGCSTGEEPYSIAITMQENGVAGRTKILATDLSTRVLAFARDGQYEGERLKSLSRDSVHRWFTRLPGPEKVYEVKKELKQMVLFKQFNLMHPFPFRNRFQVIFCRNVMIYFDRPTQERLVQKFFEVLEPGGYLFIGHSESLNSVRHSFEFIQPATYRRPE